MRMIPKDTFARWAKIKCGELWFFDDCRVGPEGYGYYGSPEGWWRWKPDLHRQFDTCQCVAVFPDGSVQLMSRDEKEVAEFRMLWELQR